MNFDSWWLCGSWELFTDPAISQCVSHFSVLGHNLSCQDTDVFSTTCWGQKRDLTNSAGSRLWALIQQIRASCTSKQTGTTLTDQLQQACSTNREKNNKDAATHQQAGRNNLVNVGQQTNFRAFAREGARDFDYWLVLIHEGSNKMRMEYCKDSNGSLCYLRATQGHSGGTHLPQRISSNFQSILGSGFIPGGKENDKARQAVFCTALNSFGKDREEEARSFDYTVPQKQHYETQWKRNQDAVFWIRLSRAQDQGLRFWQTQSFAIITYTTVPRDCIDRVTSQNGDRLATPRPAPKVTLKRYWQTQQQQPQQPKLEDDTQSVWKQRATWEAEQEFETTRNTPRKGEQPSNWCYPLLKRQMILISL